MTIKHNIVLVKNKLITIDAILPLLIELKKYHNYSSDIIVFDKDAHDGINNNVLIRDAIEYVGREVFITKGIKNKLYRRIYLIKGILLIIFKSSLGANLFHFGVLDIFPLKILNFVFKKNVYSFHGKGYSFQKQKYLIDSGNKPKSVNKSGINCISFDGNFDSCKEFKFKFSYISPRKRKVWIDYVKERSCYYREKYHNGINFNNGCIVVATGPVIGQAKKFRDSFNDSERLFINTINVLTQYSNKIPILIKPHVFTDMKTLKKIIHNKDNVFITYLHPTLLSMHARVFISNMFSNILADAHTFGVETIEYTNYNSELLKATQGKSIEEKFVTHFINDDYDRFKVVALEALSKEYEKPLFSGIVGNNSKLLDNITHNNLLR
jgi:hypothetical protein